MEGMPRHRQHLTMGTSHAKPGAPAKLAVGQSRPGDFAVRLDLVTEADRSVQDGQSQIPPPKPKGPTSIFPGYEIGRRVAIDPNDVDTCGRVTAVPQLPG